MITRSRLISAAFIFTVLTAFFYSGFLASTPFVADLRSKTTDTFFRIRARLIAPSSVLQQIIIVGVDDESISKMQRAWPWGREVFALLLDRLAASSPRVIGFDFSAVGAGVDPEADRWLAEAMSKNDRLVLSAYFDENSKPVRPLDEFANAASAVGFVEKPLDHDGVNRRFFSMLQKGSETHYSFAAWVAALYRGVNPESTPGFQAGHRSERLSYRYLPPDFQYIPAWKILGAKKPVEVTRDKIVLVGAVTPLLHDIHLTPLGLMPGVCMLGNEIMMLLNAEHIRTLPEGAELLLWAFFAGIACFVFLRLGFLSRLWLWLGMLIAGFCLFAVLFVYSGWALDYFSFALLLTLTYFAVVADKGFATFLENLRLQHQVIMDGLTGLYGHRYLMLRLESEFVKFRRQSGEFFIAMVDADHFKKVNDTYGHECGNQVLKTLASMLKGGIRGYDIAARYGGEEFAIILFNTDEAGAIQTLERIRQQVENHVFSCSDKQFKVTISIGLCSNRAVNIRAKEHLVEYADSALYEAKRQGRNRIVMYQSPTNKTNQH